MSAGLAEKGTAELDHHNLPLRLFGSQRFESAELTTFGYSLRATSDSSVVLFSGDNYATNFDVIKVRLTGN